MGKRKFISINSRGQVWVETVIYTLIALTVIGLFVSFAKPKIEEIQDKAIVEQSVQMLDGINSIILSIVQGGAGNQRGIEIGIKKGELKIDGLNDQISFELEGRYTYTEPGIDGQPGKYINIGNVLATTKKRGKLSTVTLISNYTNKYDLKFEGIENTKVITKAPISYQLSLLNKGESGGKTVIDISIK